MRPIALLAACGSPSTGGGGAATPTASAEDANRRVCHELSVADPNNVSAELNPLTWRATAQAATAASDPGISVAGAKLYDVVAANSQLSEEERVGEANLALRSAVRSLAAACGNLYGDGPW